MKRTKGSQSEIGMLYQYGVTALLAAELSENDQVENYVIYSSESSAGKFDDVVARIKLKDQDHCYLSLIQVKYKETKRLNVSDNLKGKRVERFLSDYIDCCTEIIDNLEVTCREGIPTENIRFAIFCDKGIQMPVFLRQDCTFQLSVCPHHDKSKLNSSLLPFGNKYWKFTCKDLEDSKYQQFFDRCFLYLEQPNYNKLNKQIQKVCAISSGKEIINYVKDYFNNDYLYKQGLCKEVFEIELQRIRLSDSISPLTAFEELTDDNRVVIWNQITLEHDITQINSMQNFTIQSCLYSCVVQRLNTLLKSNINWNEHVLKRKNVDPEIIKKFIAFSKIKKFRYWINPPHTLQLLMIELWKCGDLPLILEAHTKLIDFERYAHLKRNYIIIDNLINQSEEIPISKLNIFSCLNSIANRELQDSILQNTLVSLQGRDPISLRSLLVYDKELMSTFTSADLLEMMRKRIPFLQEDALKGRNYLTFIIEDEKCAKMSNHIEPYLIGHNITLFCPPGKTNECIKIIQENDDIYRYYTIYHLRRIKGKLVLTKGDPKKLNHYFVDQYGDPLFTSNDDFFPVIGQTIQLNELQYIRRQLKRPILPMSFLNSNKTLICFLSGELDIIGRNVEFSNVDSITDKTISTTKKAFFVRIAEENKHQYHWNKLRHLGYPICDIYVNNGKLELLRFQHCANLELHVMYDGETYSEDTFFNEIKKKGDEITVITGDVGIGKTSLLKWFCNNYSTEDYIIFYDLINLQVDLNKSDNQKINVMEFILKEILKKIQARHINFISHLWKKKRLIWVLDSFDEIRLACEKQVLDFIRLIADSGVQIVIATRSENSKILMDQFGVRLIRIQPLDQYQCSLYWQLNRDALENVSPELLTNPLYLNFLKIISINREEFIKITKFTLYEKIINMNIRRCLQRTYRILHVSEVERTVSLFEKLALVVVFGKEMVTEELYWTIDKEVSDITKFGIITSFDEDSYPIFSHRSFVEFLVARWLAKAHQISIYKGTARYFYRQIFNENKLHMLNILFEETELHNAIFQSNISQLKAIMKKDPKCWNIVDKLGRTAMHAAIIRCGCSDLTLLLPYDTLEFIITSMLQNSYDMNKRDVIMDWDWSEYVQTEIFEFACVFQKTEAVKIYLQLQRQKLEKYNCATAVFPTKKFNTLFNNAIQLTSIDIIENLVFLQNFGNRIFHSFYQTCLRLIPESIRFWTKDIQFEGRLTLMHVACIYGNIPMIQHLIKEGCDINALDQWGCMPLYYSIMRCASLTPKSTANINAKTICEESNSVDAVKLLLDSGAICNSWILFVDKVTPLYLAVQTMKVNVVRMLLENGADICPNVDSDDTPLHLAAKLGNLDMVRCLLDYKAPRLLKNKRGETAIDIAIKHNHTEIIALLNEKKYTTDEQEEKSGSKDFGDALRGTPLHDAIYSGHLDINEALNEVLRKGGNINVRNRNGFTPLHVALYVNVLEDIALMRGADVDAQDKYGRTPLHIAIKRGNIDVVEMILNRGANPNTANMSGDTPLFTAIIENDITAVKLLLKMGANVNIQRLCGCTPLYTAAEKGNEDIVKLLLDNKADTEISDENGTTPLHVSVWFQYKTICELLLRNGANANVQNQQGRTPLVIAVFKKDIDIVRLLLENGASINGEDMRGDTPLHLAANNGCENILKLLLKYGANINARDRKGDSVLYIAAVGGQRHIVALLLEANVFIDHKGGDTALRLAIFKGDINTVKLLLSGGADVNIRNQYSITPLHLAAEMARPVTTDLLLKYGADINAKSNLDSTPLHHALIGGNEDIIKLLINCGADLNAETKDRCTPLDFALKMRSINVVKMILKGNVNIDSKVGFEILTFAVSIGDIDVIKILQSKGVNINIDSENGCTLLYIATVKKHSHIIELLLENETNANFAMENAAPFLKFSKSSDMEITRLLLDNGANVNASIGDTTALHLKIAEGNIDFVSLLIEKGADVNLRTEDDKSPLQIAVDCEFTNIVEVLINEGADVNASTSSGGSLLRLAARKQNASLVEFLLEKGADIITDNAHGITLLHDCAREGNIKIMQVLLKTKIDVNIQDKIGNTALHIGVIAEKPDVIKLLFTKNVNAEIENYKGETSFHLAIRKIYADAASCKNEDIKNNTISCKVDSKEKNVEVIWSLLENMRKINVSAKDEIQVFFWAAEKGYFKIVELLLDKGMKVNVQNAQGCTALHLAVNNSKYDIVEILLERGADVYLKNNNESTPLNFTQLIQILLKKSTDNIVIKEFS